MNKTKNDLINSNEFENAILEGVECKKLITSEYKKANKTNYEQFFEMMLNANKEVSDALSKPKKKRSEAQQELIEHFRKKVRKQYNFVTEFMEPEKKEEDKLTKIEKLAEKISYSLNFLRFIGNNNLDKTFEKYGLSVSSLDQVPEKFNEEGYNEAVKSIFDCSLSLKQNIKEQNTNINEVIFETKVPIELQFDKNTNQDGLKSSDFRKLVDAKTKLESAKSEEEKEKIEDKIQILAANAQFDISRSELLRDKLSNL